MFCEACQQVVAQIKADLPGTKEKLEQLKGICKAGGTEERVKKCEKDFDDLIANLDKLDKETPEQICTEIGFCGKRSLLGLLGL